MHETHTQTHTYKSPCATILSFTRPLFPSRGREQETRGKLLHQPSVSGGITSWEMRSDTEGGGSWLELKPGGVAHPEAASIQSGYWNQTVAARAGAKLQGVFRNYTRQTGENNQSQNALVNNAAVCKWAAVIVLLLFLRRSLSVASEHDCYFIPAVTVALFIYLFISSFQTRGNPNKRQQNKSISTPHIHAEYYGNKTSPLTGISPHQSPVWCLRGSHWLKGLVSMYGLSYVSVVSLIRVFLCLHSLEGVG